MKKGARSEVKKMGPLKVAALNGLSLSRLPMHDEGKDELERASNDEKVRQIASSLWSIMYSKVDFFGFAENVFVNCVFFTQFVNDLPCIRALLQLEKNLVTRRSGPFVW